MLQMHGIGLNSLRVERGRAADRAEAMALVFSALPPAERDRQVAAWTACAAAPSTAVWIGRRAERMTAALLAQIRPGRTATVFPPRAAADEPAETAQRLLAACVNDLESQGVRLAQALLATDHGSDADVLVRGGFRHACDLLYLVSLAESFPAEAPSDSLQFVSYSAAEHKRLAKLVEVTYEGSLDCPQLDRVREIEDVLAGYRAVGEFDPQRWFVAHDGTADVGCLLLADDPANNSWELVYMGVVPAARGRGLGVALARWAQWLAAKAGRRRLTAAVDAANEPAIRAYAAAGFVTWDGRSVFLRVL
jgi:RimJ/RimL family protein N-acetyltransferase